jgi:hypothetical protein
MDKIEAVKLRADMVNGQFTLDANTTAFMALVRVEFGTLAQRLAERAPPTCDVGRFIAAIDHMQQTKNLFCDSAILGIENETRKKRKLAETSASSGARS